VTRASFVVIREAAVVCLPSDETRDPVVVEKLAKTGEGAEEDLLHQQILQLGNDGSFTADENCFGVNLVADLR
jgi:hypothetical protein